MSKGETRPARDRDLTRRILMGAVGALAGAAFWYLGDRGQTLLPDPRAFLGVSALAAAWFAAVLVLAGPLGFGRAVLTACVTAPVAAGLLALSAFRYDAGDSPVTRPEHLFAFSLLTFLPLPYAIALSRPGAGWRHYPTLFSESWGIVLRLAAASLFAALVWLVVFLSDELLRLVEIDVIRRLIEVEWVPFTFTGLVSGVAMALVDEMAALASPVVVLRFLRLMAPAALIVVGAFVAAIPVRGLDTLFGTLSPAGTLLGMAGLLVLLVSSVADADDARAARSTVARLSARGLALVLPVLAALALWSIWLRVDAAGFSPERLAGAVAGAFILAYGLAYAASALGGAGWMARIRRANAWLALAVIGVAALWLSPALDAERLSAESQLSRFAEGRTEAERLDLWTLRHDWGRAGRDAVAAVEEMAPGRPDEATLRDRLALSAQAPDRAAFEDMPRDPTILNARAELKRLMPVQPPQAAADFDRYLLPWYAGSVAGFLEGCRDRTGNGRPGCVLIVADLIPDNPGDEAILFYKSFGLLRGEVIVPEPVFRRADAAEVFSLPQPDFAETDALIEALQDGAFETGPARINAITIGGRQFTVPH